MSNADNAASRRLDPAEYTARFQNLVQSPLRAGILRFMCARPDETFDVEALMQTFGRMRLDVDNCLRPLVEAGLVRKLPGAPIRYAARLGTGSRRCSSQSVSIAAISCLSALISLRTRSRMPEAMRSQTRMAG